MFVSEPPTQVIVQKKKLRILLFAGGPNHDYQFLRTLLHEICHHLDYHLYRLPDSFHTEGFYKRESSLFHQLVPDGE